jgi:hypothetical protein
MGLGSLFFDRSSFEEASVGHHITGDIIDTAARRSQDRHRSRENQPFQLADIRFQPAWRDVHVDAIQGDCGDRQPGMLPTKGRPIPDRSDCAASAPEDADGQSLRHIRETCPLCHSSRGARLNHRGSIASDLRGE